VIALFFMPLSASALTLRLQLQWVPQAQFAGYYVAQDLGWYEQAGLDVEILPHGPEFPPTQIMADEAADIAVFNLSEALQLMDAGVQLVNLQQFKRVSSLVFVALASSNISTPSDLDGLRVARWSYFSAKSEAFFRRYGIKPEIVNQGASMAPLRSGAVDVAMATRYNELVQLYLGGLDQDDLVVLPFADHVASMPEDGIYVRLQQWQLHEQALRQFVEITRRGWQYAFDHPDEAIRAVMQRAYKAGVETNQGHQMLMLAALRDYYLEESGQLHDGQLDQNDFALAWRLLRDNDMVRGDDTPSYQQFHQR
jgi:NitT/TauT family transport system substrate-binding protein